MVNLLFHTGPCLKCNGRLTLLIKGSLSKGSLSVTVMLGGELGIEDYDVRPANEL